MTTTTTTTSKATTTRGTTAAALQHLFCFATDITPRGDQIKEEDGDVAGAAEVLQEVHVETYGALTKKEKADFILEQVSAA